MSMTLSMTNSISSGNELNPNPDAASQFPKCEFSTSHSPPLEGLGEALH